MFMIVHEPTPYYMRRKDLAIRLGVSQRTIASWMRKHLVPFYKPSPGITLFSVAEVDLALRKFRKRAVGESM